LNQKHNILKSRFTDSAKLHPALSTESGDLDRQIHYIKVFTEQILPHFQ